MLFKFVYVDIVFFFYKNTIIDLIVHASFGNT